MLLTSATQTGATENSNAGRYSFEDRIRAEREREKRETKFVAFD